jgi:L-alanine-DL-glutamate epimerase-like enolase superfamily enzyme
MKIRNIEIDFLSLELADPYTVAYETFDKADHVFIRLDTGEISGWGCMAPDSQVTGEHARLIYPEASEKLPDLLRGSDPLRRAKIMERVRHELPNYSSLQAAVDMALWDILGKKAGLPVWKILGGYRSRIETSVTIGICHVEDTIRYAESHIDRGFRILKIKGALPRKTISNGWLNSGSASATASASVSMRIRDTHTHRHCGLSARFSRLTSNFWSSPPGRESRNTWDW